MRSAQDDEMTGRKGGAVKIPLIAALIFALCVSVLGCGETISGIGKDASRMGRGVNTFLFRQP
jgi:predicted small secreted protein